MSQLEAILGAIQILSRLSLVHIQDLLPHRITLEHTLQIISQALVAIHHESSRQRECSVETSSQLASVQSSVLYPRSFTGSPISSSIQTSISRANERDGSISDYSEHIAPEARKISQILSDPKRSKKIWEYLSAPESDPIRYRGDDWTHEDPRVIDIRFCTRSHSLDAKFRRGLGQRSLAQEYDEWEKKTFRTSRVLTLYRDITAAEDLNGHINQFLSVNNHRFKDKNTALHGIKHGIRLLVFERIYDNIGISSILIPLYSHFRGIKYKTFKTLKNLLQASFLWDSLARDKYLWLEKCQHRYDGEFSRIHRGFCLISVTERSKVWQRIQNNLRSTFNNNKESQRAASDVGNSTAASSDLPHLRSLCTTLQEGQHYSHSQSIATALRQPHEERVIHPPFSLALDGVAGIFEPRPIAETPLAMGSNDQSNSGCLTDQQSSARAIETVFGTNVEDVYSPAPIYDDRFEYSNSTDGRPIHPFNPFEYPGMLSQPPPGVPEMFPRFDFNPLEYPTCNFLSDNNTLMEPQQPTPHDQFLQPTVDSGFN